MEYWSTKPTVIQPGVYAARTLAPDGELEEVPVRVMNVRSEPQTLRAEVVVGELEQVEQVEQVNSVDETVNMDPPSSEPEPAYVEQLIKGVDPSVPESAVLYLRQLLLENRKVFSESELDLGETNVSQHRINTEGARPIRCLLYTSPSPRDGLLSRMPSSA